MTHTYSITGMTCSGCASKVKSKFEKHQDVILAEISLEQNEVEISMNKHIPTVALQQLFGIDSKYNIIEKESL
ncbi:MAG: heavy metal transporter, partial [Flavobacteriales bacterium]